MKTTHKLTIYAISATLLFIVSSPQKTLGRDGRYPNTEHGGADTTYPDRSYYPNTDGVSGVNRARSILEAFQYQNYADGECNHCHEVHSSFEGSEPVPNWLSHGSKGEGPDKFFLFADYDNKTSSVEFCGYCHTETDPDANGVDFDTPDSYSFKGVPAYQKSAHYAPPSGRAAALWPGGEYGSTYPAKTLSESGACVNCHTPHGEPYSSSDLNVSFTINPQQPFPKQLVELTDINDKNPVVSPIINWPNANGYDPNDAEDLCYTCHDGSPVQNQDLSGYNRGLKWNAGVYANYETSIKGAFSNNSHHPVIDSEQEIGGATTGTTSYFRGYDGVTLAPAKPLAVHNRVECVTCHNPHVASGRWDDAVSGVDSPSPIVLPGTTHQAYLDGISPDDWPPISWGMTYKAGDLWGDEPDEKINALLQRLFIPNSVCGTGGWQVKVDEGYPLGTANLPCDSPPVYSPPFGGTNPNPSLIADRQPDGDALPDYITFCLDCHQHKLGTHMPIYWGGDFPPGLKTHPNFACGWGATATCERITRTGVEPHGFDAANRAPFNCCGVGYKCADPISNPEHPFYGFPRGAGNSVFSRSPYNMVDRNAGINYVLSCTDCHEPHGSGMANLLREVINGSTMDWTHNTICNACHWYYAGDMTYNGCGGGGLKSCSYASCHEVQSLHRMDRNHMGGDVVLFDPSSEATFPNKCVQNGNGIVNGAGVIGLWNFDGAGLDSSANSNDIAALIGQASYAATGKFGSALLLDGDRDAARVKTNRCVNMRVPNTPTPDNPADSGANNVTVEAWIYPTSIEQGMDTILSWMHSYGMGYHLYYQSNTPGSTSTSNHLTFMTGSWEDDPANQWRRAYANVSLTMNDWNYVAATYDANDPAKPIRIYQNGADVTATYTGTSAGWMQPLQGWSINTDRDKSDCLSGGSCAGWWNDLWLWHNRLTFGFEANVGIGTTETGLTPEVNGWSWPHAYKGRIDDVRVSNITLTPDQICSRYNKGLLGLPASWNLADDTGYPASECDPCGAPPNGKYIWNFNEGAASATVTEASGAPGLSGTVNSALFSLIGDGTFTGNENQATYIDLDKSASCLVEANAITIETRVFTSEVDLDFNDISPANGFDDDFDTGGAFSSAGDGRNSTQQRIFERKRQIQLMIVRGNWMDSNYPATTAGAGKAYIMVKYKADDLSRHSCPNPAWPTDTYSGPDAAWRQLRSSRDYPIIQGHWYQIKVVFDSANAYQPVNIWADDQGTDGAGTGELWAGFKNVSIDMYADEGCQYGGLPGDLIETLEFPAAIGDNLNHNDLPNNTNNTLFKGKIDWISWQPTADYLGVDDPVMPIIP